MVLVHAAPSRLNVMVRSVDEHLLAIGADLRAAGETPISRLTFAGLYRYVLKLGGALRKLGVKERTHVAVISENRTQWALAYLTCMAFDYVVVPDAGLLDDRARLRAQRHVHLPPRRVPDLALVVDGDDRHLQAALEAAVALGDDLIERAQMIFRECDAVEESMRHSWVEAMQYRMPLAISM